MCPEIQNLATDPADLLVALQVMDTSNTYYEVSVDIEGWGGPLGYRDGKSMYAPSPEEAVWRSVTPAGEGAVDEYGDWVHSSGSFWFSFVPAGGPGGDSPR